MAGFEDGAAQILLRATVLIVLAFGCAAALKHRSASMRAAVWRALFLGLLVLPVLPAVAPALPWLAPRTDAGVYAPQVLARGAQEPDGAVGAVLAAGVSPELDLDARTAARSDGGAARPAFAAIESRRDARLESRSFVGPWLVWVWGLGTTLALLPLLFGLIRARGIVRRARALSHLSSPSTLPARCVESDAKEAPFVWDLRPFAPPTIVLATRGRDAIASMPAATIAHESAHVQRRDMLFFLLARAAVAMLWMHPLVWLAAKRLRIESERACDDAVLLAGVRATDYADALVRTMCHASGLPVPAIAGRAPMSERIEAIVSGATERAPLRVLQRVCVAAVAAAVALTVAGVQRAEAESPLPLSAPLPGASTSRAAAPPAQEGDASVPAAQDPDTARNALYFHGLASLVALQDKSTGAWHGDLGFKLNSKWQVTTEDAPHVGVTGLALEALVRAGVTGVNGETSASIELALNYLLEQQDDKGYFTASTSRMRSHAHAVRGVAAVHMTESSPRTRAALDAAIRFALKSGAADPPGWRFVPMSPSVDILETSYQLDALRAAVRALEIDQKRADGEEAPEVATLLASAGDRIARVAVSVDRYRSPGDARGIYRFEPHPRARVTANTLAGGLYLHRAGTPQLPSEISAGLVRIVELRAKERTIRDASHFLNWDTELLAWRALAGADPAAGEALDARDAWRAGTYQWLEAASVEGVWRTSVGPGDAYAQAVACLLLSAP